MHVEGATRLFHRDENGVLKVGAHIYGSMSRAMQCEVEDELRRDNERREEAADNAIAAKLTEPVAEDVPVRMRDPLNSVGDALLNAGRSLPGLADRVQAMGAVMQSAANQLVGAARLLHARTTRVWG